MKKIIICLIIIILLLLFFIQNNKENFINTDEINNLFSNGFIAVEKDEKKYNNNNITYGEISNEGIKILSDLTEKKNLFIDLGCGSGRSLAYALNNNFNKAKGVELVLERVEYGKEHIKLLPSNIKDNIEIIHNDILKLTKDYFTGANIIYISNLMYPNEINNDIFKLLSKNIDKNTLVAVSKIPTDLHDLILIKEIIVPMSWDNKSILYIFKKS
jgi:SAM-dependent methyltransferase